MKRTSNFTLLLILVILMTIGAAVLPLIDVAEQPRERQGRKLTITYRWPGASAKVMEQNVTSKLEGLVSAVKGVQSSESLSAFGSGRIVVELKPQAAVSAVKFEILSLLRQTYKQLPDGVTYPDLKGGEVVTGSRSRETERLLLTYQINADMNGRQLQEHVTQVMEHELSTEQLIKRMEVTGAMDKYIEITYDPLLLSINGLTTKDIESAIKVFMGREDIVGDVMVDNERKALYLTTESFSTPLEQIPIKTISDKTVTLGNLASFDYKDKLPDEYFRINGLNTVYLNIYTDASADKISASRRLRQVVTDASSKLKSGICLTLEHDDVEVADRELTKLIWRTALALLILLGFVWLISRSWRYLLIISISLLANILISSLAYWALDIRLHIYSSAGITVSMGMIIDATVVMADHYSYYRDRRAFLAILAALLTTTGALVVVCWLPESIKKDMYDFTLIIMVNLTVALIVAYCFVPAMIDVMHYSSVVEAGRIHRKRMAVYWKRWYTRYVIFTQKRKWIYIILTVLAFGIPFHLLPESVGEITHTGYNGKVEEKRPWYEDCYNATLGSAFYQHTVNPVLVKVCGGAWRLFSKSLAESDWGHDKEKEMVLHVQGKMPLGGSVHELNEKVMKLEEGLSQFKEIKRFETHVTSWGATVNVKFTEKAQNEGFPYVLENKVIGQVISIGGADWSTYGVSERGFSNSLNLQHRSNRIELVGYNYDRLYRIAEDICREMKKNNRVVDLTIQTPRHEEQEDEFNMGYDRERMALYDFDTRKAHTALSEIVSGHWIGQFKDDHLKADMYLKPLGYDNFDLWHLSNAQIRTNESVNVTLSDFMAIERREAKNAIPKRNQQYVLHVAFNVLGSYTYTSNYIGEIVDRCNASMPVGFKCQNVSYGWQKDTGEQYWMMPLVIVIIFFVTAILFESLRLPLNILSLIPMTFTGVFLTYSMTGVRFGTGGYAALVLLAGLSVNGGIYVISEYRAQSCMLKKQKEDNFSNILPSTYLVKAYVKAYNHKIYAVFLTLFSTILSLIPFLINTGGEPFWFSFATGTVGGLVFSVIALVLFMPITLRLHSQTNKNMCGNI